ncbi:MAG: thiamine biosynthesis lipoprotein [Arcticibacterium sp.]|jgi:thiamine biosynthesis lipoprotein
MGKLVFLCLAVSIGFVSCKSKNKSYSAFQGYAQGSTFRIVYEPVSDVDFIGPVDSILAVIDHSMSLWDSTSLIRRVNESADPQMLDEHFVNVFNRSRDFYELSQGSFDPSVSPLIEAWGFARGERVVLPSQSQIDSLLNLVGLGKFHLLGDILVKDIPNTELNFNAIAQGYTVDVLGFFLESHGVRNYLVELGGETKAKGFNKSGVKWKVGIERPDYNIGSKNNVVQTVVGLSNVALVTSGSYRKFIEKDGKKYSHTLNPKTGKPVTHSLLSVVVVDSSAMDADAYATFFMVVGKDSALEYAEKYSMAIQCTFDEAGEMKIVNSTAFEALIIEEL